MEMALVACFLQGMFLFVLVGAQVNPPTMLETFVASGELEVHAPERTFMGKFTIQRNYDNQMGLEGEEYEGRNQEDRSVSESLYRYDMNKTYYLRGDMKMVHCIEEVRNFNGMPKYWDWLTYAIYEGTTKLHEVVFDFWGINIGGVRFEFGAPQNQSSILYFYRRKTAELSVYYTFFKFSDSTPEDSAFDVPGECKK